MQVEETPRKPLPPEVWQLVFCYLPRAHECLHVSKLFHDLAARRLFSNLRIQFGPSTEDDLFAVEPPEDSGCNSCCLLLQIITEPVFASYVRHLQVLAFANHNATFELCCLTRAIGCLRNLRSLKWYTRKPTLMLPTSNLLDTLASNCKSLREIQLPLQSLTASQALGQLRITSLSVVPSTPEIEEYRYSRASFAALLAMYRGSLVELAAPGQAIWECPIHILQDLTHLTITSASHLSNITLLFHHCARLQSLCIIRHASDEQGPEYSLSAALAEDPAALPNLTHLKLRLLRPMDVDFRMLADFVGTKMKLRCPDFSDRCSAVSDMRPLLSVLRSLPDLEVLGLDLVYHTIEAATFLDLRRALPDKLTALRLWLFYSGVESSHDWSLWADLPNLAFTYVDDDANYPFIDKRDLAAAAKSLQLIGGQWTIREVQRAGEDVELGSPWSVNKLMYRTAGDFGCGDWEWLMRGHNLFNQRMSGAEPL